MNREKLTKIWQKYQKEIPEDNYFFVRSCVRQAFFPGAEQMFVRIMRDVLKKNLYIHPLHSTCSGIAYHADIVPLETTMTVVARQFSLMNESGYNNFVPSCVTSFGVYNEMIHMWEHYPHMLEKTKSQLKAATGRDFQLPAHVLHSSDLFYKFRMEIAEKAKYTLTDQKNKRPLKVVDHVGCHYAKIFPDAGVGGAEYTQVLSGMVDAWGGETVDYPERRHCCGFGFRQYFIQENRGYCVAQSQRKFESMEPCQPDLIVCNCPGCSFFLDRWQYVISEVEGKTYGPDNEGIPVFTFEELAALVLGYDPWEIGLQLHQVPCEPVLDKMGVKYDPEKKFMLPFRHIVDYPEKPNVLKWYI
ncbi:MAG: heterodisulfide reductase subunit [Bacteroidales bacterium]|jgi:heterodisulfide reductase subunit B|nr:heterodisulfide reductase subunit [Bacteroidales bacterium]MDN5329984.1 heterodisulfide reductase subunit [Bacteroidales bacterium]